MRALFQPPRWPLLEEHCWWIPHWTSRALVGAIAWPLVVVVLAIVFRGAVGDVFGTARQRGFKLGLPGGLSFDLPGATEAHVNWVSGREEIDLRGPVSAASILDSTQREFTTQLLDRTPAQYATVDLGDGAEWLSSRLYIMSILLARLRSIDAFVFLETRGNQPGCLVGWAHVDDVRWQLARASPRFEQAFIRAAHDLEEQSPSPCRRSGCSSCAFATAKAGVRPSRYRRRTRSCFATGDFAVAMVSRSRRLRLAGPAQRGTTCPAW
jgi:hypothetical protein